jgi:hypothetical protein
MMKATLTAAAVGLVMLSLLAWLVTGGASAADLPSGVDPALWHPLTDRLGLALKPEPGLAGRMEFVGTLMVKIGEAWHPVHLEALEPRVRPVQ